MGIFPVTPLVRTVQCLIVEAFDVSEHEAEALAAELVALAEGWGTPESAAQHDWAYRIRKSLGHDRKLNWRSDEERVRFEESLKLNHAAYEAMIPKRPCRA
ncbi:hypothetical protein [Verrucomicrobium sp. BvORR034]|uniref:hypothetical protein n=1 Tax=Verrucomicrobium sp. BvORR034 TaxID=1396418 RepID=UPI0006795624|nr:hypothetical protein [Verrucomicrobium sp. BvORR034]